MTGFSITATRSSPSMSAATRSANRTLSASFTVTGYSSRYSISTSSPCAAATPWQTRIARSRTCTRIAGSKVRTVASKVAFSGMMLRRVPAWSDPTVSATGENASTCRLIAVCSATTISQVAGTGSRDRCGDELCPASPRTVTSMPSLAAISGPGRVTSCPLPNMFEITCSANAASGRRPAASSTPSFSIFRAPS